MTPGHLIPIALGILTLLSYFVGFLLPYLIRILTRNLTDDNERFIVTFLICFIAAMVLDFKAFNSGNIASMVAWISVVFTESQTTFKLYFKPKWDNALDSSLG